MSEHLIRTSKDIDGAWLGGVLGDASVDVTSVEEIGTGQMSESYRVTYSANGGGPQSLVVKLASEDESSRSTGVGFGAYLREITFYRELRDRIGGPLAACSLAEYDEKEGWFTLVLEDIRGAEQGDQIAGVSPEVARIALSALARIQAPVLGDLALAATDWLNQPNPLNQGLLTALLPAFLERYGDRVAPEHEAVCRRFIESADAWTADARPPLGLVHGDFRPDNILFKGDDCTVVDWQTLSWGPAMLDASYFLAGGLTVADRREHEEALIRGYHDELTELGVRGFAWDECWAEYSRQCFLGIVMTVAASMVTQQTERGDDMFMTVLERTAQMAIDHGALDQLPPPGEGAGAALRPEPADEGRHEPGGEELWNESWYFDAISDDGEAGVYHRVGLVPNLGSCLLSTCIVRVGEPAIMLVDPAGPMPPGDDGSLVVESDGVRAEQVCEEALERFRVRVEGTAAAHADHSAPLRGEAGEPVEIAVDLTWETEGVPYQWRLATRYEIPCRVSGSVRVGDEEFKFSGPGQRDHSWGARDWWASDWMWSALHLSDGTRTHAVTVPTHPDFGVGYVQRDGELTELNAISSTAEVSDDGLTSAATITMSPQEGPIEVEVEPVAFGAILLEAPDGRVSHFPRAMCRLRCADGRTGVGWVEWNRNQPR